MDISLQYTIRKEGSQDIAHLDIVSTQKRKCYNIDSYIDWLTS